MEPACSLPDDKCRSMYSGLCNRPLILVLHRTTGDDVKTVFKYYTFPQVILGFIIFGVAAAIQILYPV